MFEHLYKADNQLQQVFVKNEKDEDFLRDLCIRN